MSGLGSATAHVHSFLLGSSLSTSRFGGGGAVPPDRTGGTTAVRALDCHVSHLQKHQLCQQQGARRRAGALLIAHETCYCRGCCACIPS